MRETKKQTSSQDANTSSNIQSKEGNEGDEGDEHQKGHVTGEKSKAHKNANTLTHRALQEALCVRKRSPASNRPGVGILPISGPSHIFIFLPLFCLGCLPSCLPPRLMPTLTPTLSLKKEPGALLLRGDVQTQDIETKCFLGEAPGRPRLCTGCPLGQSMHLLTACFASVSISAVPPSAGHPGSGPSSKNKSPMDTPLENTATKKRNKRKKFETSLKQV